MTNAGLSASEAVNAYALVSAAEGEKGPDGKTISGSEKLDAMRMIDTLEISNAKKLAALEAMGYNTDETMWNTKYRGNDYESYYFLSDAAKKAYLSLPWMSVKEFARHYSVCSGYTADKKDGESVSGSRLLKVMQYINKLDESRDNKNALLQAMGYTLDEDDVTPWNTLYRGRDFGSFYYLSATRRQAYLDYCSWAEVKDFSRWMADMDDIHSIKDAGGKVVTAKMTQIIAYIDGLQLADDQKTALFNAAGYSSKNYKYCPWNTYALPTPVLAG